MVSARTRLFSKLPRLAIFALILAGVAACVARYELDITGTEVPAAVGAEYSLGLALYISNNCGNTKTSICLDNDAYVRRATDVSLEPADVFQSLPPNDQSPVRLLALKEGKATLRVTAEASNGKSYSNDTYVYARQANRLKWVNLCFTQERAQDTPILVITDDTFLAQLWMYKDNVLLRAENYLPVEFGALSVERNSPYPYYPSQISNGDLHVYQELSLKTPATPQTITLTSNIDPNFQPIIQVVSPTEIDSLTLTADRNGPYLVGQDIATDTRGSIQGEEVCGYLQKSAVIETPDVCEFSNGETTINNLKSEIYLRGTAPGSCRVTATVDSGVSAVLDIVFEPS